MPSFNFRLLAIIVLLCLTSKVMKVEGSSISNGGGSGGSGGGGIVTYSGPALTLTGTVYFPIGGGGLSSTTESNVNVESPSNATISNMYVQLNAALTAGTAVVTWRKNGAGTAVTCTISGSATTCNDIVHTFSVVQGDLVDIQIVASSSTAAALVLIATQYGTTTSNISRVINFLIDGGGTAITTGAQTIFPSVNYSCTINKVMVSADQSGSITVDVWKANAAIPTSGDKISASAPVTLSSSQLNQSSSLSGWTTTIAANDVFGFSVASASTVQRVLGEIWCQ